MMQTLPTVEENTRYAQAEINDLYQLPGLIN